MSSGAVIPCRASSRPPRLSAAVCGELVKTAREETTSSPPFLLPAVCVSSCPAAMSPPVRCPRRACLPRMAAGSRRCDVSGSPLVLAPPCSPPSRVVGRGGMICPFSFYLLARCAVIVAMVHLCGGLFGRCCSCLPRPAAARLSSRSSRRLSRLACPPRLLVSGSGEVGVVVIRLSCSYRFPGRLRLRLAS